MNRYALVDSPRARSRVHQVASDDQRNALDGTAVSLKLRFSRRDVEALKNREDCGNCVAIIAARKKRGR